MLRGLACGPSFVLWPRLRAAWDPAAPNSPSAPSHPDLPPGPSPPLALRSLLSHFPLPFLGSASLTHPAPLPPPGLPPASPYRPAFVLWPSLRHVAQAARSLGPSTPVLGSPAFRSWQACPEPPATLLQDFHRRPQQERPRHPPTTCPPSPTSVHYARPQRNSRSGCPLPAAPPAHADPTPNPRQPPRRRAQPPPTWAAPNPAHDRRARPLPLQPPPIAADALRRTPSGTQRTPHRPRRPIPACNRPTTPPASPPNTGIHPCHSRTPNPPKKRPPAPQEFFGKNSYCARDPQFSPPQSPRTTPPNRNPRPPAGHSLNCQN